MFCSFMCKITTWTSRYNVEFVNNHLSHLLNCFPHINWQLLCRDIFLNPFGWCLLAAICFPLFQVYQHNNHIDVLLEFTVMPPIFCFTPKIFTYLYSCDDLGVFPFVGSNLQSFENENRKRSNSDNLQAPALLCQLNGYAVLFESFIGSLSSSPEVSLPSQSQILL